MIRPAVSPDFTILSSFKHAIETQTVWQMDQDSGEKEIAVHFREMKLPRLMKLSYPRSTNNLLERWKELSVLWLPVVDNVPIGYISHFIRHLMYGSRTGSA
jgi:hypothetical protein